jgi:uridine kinase
MSSPENFALKDLVASESLQLYSRAADLDSAFDRIMPRDSGDFIKAPLLVGIDGSVTAGKSFTSKGLFNYLSQHGVACVLIHGDWFMSPREQRKLEVEKATRGSYEIADYDAVACNFDALEVVQHEVKEFLRGKSDCAEIVVPNAYNRATGECDKEISIALPKKPVVIFEGTGVLGPVLHKAFDLTIRVDINSYEEAIKRLGERELEKASSQRLSPVFIKNRYSLIDYPYDQYLRSRDRKNFDVLLDTSCLGSVKIYKR